MTSIPAAYVLHFFDVSFYPDWVMDAKICFFVSVPVMRRKLDSWMNATQILKVADFDKPQRTRILEREVQKGTHEKVQGGYGKYQGLFSPTPCTFIYMMETDDSRDLGTV